MIAPPSFSQAAVTMSARVHAVSQAAAQWQFHDLAHATRVTRLLERIQRLIMRGGNLIVLQGDDGAEALYPSEAMIGLMDDLDVALRARPADPLGVRA